jgi:alpha-mannosidase
VEAAQTGKDFVHAFNTSNLPRREVVALPSSTGTPARDRLATQAHGNQTLVMMEDRNGSGVATVATSSDWEPVTCHFAQGSWIISNESLEVKVSTTGRITSLFDLRDK